MLRKEHFPISSDFLDSVDPSWDKRYYSQWNNENNGCENLLIVRKRIPCQQKQWMKFLLDLKRLYVIKAKVTDNS